MFHLSLCSCQIPGLMSLKRLSSVVFVGIDSLDDIKNNSCIELFVSGGCIVSDELVLSPDVITYGTSLSKIQMRTFKMFPGQIVSLNVSLFPQIDSPLC